VKKNFLITTGGSGGHVIPAEILSDHLNDKFNISISTDLRGRKYLKIRSNEIIIINTPRLNFNLLIIFKLIKLIYLTITSCFFLKKNKISKVFSTGGYMSIPICISAKFLGLDLYLLEPNFVLGKSNKLFLKFCNKIFCYSENLKNFPKKFKNKIIIISPLVRKKFYEKKLIEHQNQKFCLLVVGGSQGAKIFENIIPKVIVNLSTKHNIKIIQQTRTKNIDRLRKIYDSTGIENIIFDFDENFVNLVNQSDFCITRGGASSLAEMSLMNKPFLAIPLDSAKDNHQFENANFYKNQNCCWIMNQENFDIDKLEHFLNSILTDKTDYMIKKDNMNKLNFKNSWNNVNQKLLESINEN
jgi:UDP-N-acetylglucosamine--N-acetylmuramyl-(pentapeptide) pyrophosphoryl-undecaprenol N-acetylglucosamine transferase